MFDVMDENKKGVREKLLNDLIEKLMMMGGDDGGNMAEKSMKVEIEAKPEGEEMPEMGDMKEKMKGLDI